MYATDSTTDVTTNGWVEFHTELAATLADLHKGQVCTIFVARSSPAVEPDRRGLARRVVDTVLGRGVRDVEPHVTFFEIHGSLFGECGGPADSDGWVQLTTEQQIGIEALGWARATGEDRARHGYPNYCVYFPHVEGVLSRARPDHVPAPYPELVDIGEAVNLAVDTLRGPLGAATPRKLRVRRSK